MSNLFKAGITFLKDQSEAYLSESCAYRRGPEVLASDFSATVCAPEVNDSDGTGGYFNSKMFDFIFAASHISSAPEIGDIITTGGIEYQVIKDVVGDSWRFSDPYGVRYRVHAQRIGDAND